MPPLRSERGFALIMALWSIALCAAAAGYGLQQSMKLSDELTAEQEVAHAKMALRAGEATARDMIQRAMRSGHNPTGRSRVAYDGFDILIVIEDEAQKLNPNDANTEALASVLKHIGADVAAAEVISERIADYLDRDAQPRPNGAEAPAYLRAGLAPPKNAPIRNLEELWGVLGFTEFVDRLDTDVELSSVLTVNARGKGQFDRDRSEGAQGPAGAPPALARGPFRISLNAKRQQSSPPPAQSPSVARSRTLIVAAPSR